MARFIKFDQKKINRLKREAQQFQDDIVCAVGTDFMENIAKAENKMIFDILKGLEDDAAADVVPKSEVDRLTNILDSYALQYGTVMDKHIVIEKARQEVAREIFEEIEKFSYRFMNDKHYLFGDMVWDIAELKKKYTESEGEG